MPYLLYSLYSVYLGHSVGACTLVFLWLLGLADQLSGSIAAAATTTRRRPRSLGSKRLLLKPAWPFVSVAACRERRRWRREERTLGVCIGSSVGNALGSAPRPRELLAKFSGSHATNSLLWRRHDDPEKQKWCILSHVSRRICRRRRR